MSFDQQMENNYYVLRSLSINLQRKQCILRNVKKITLNYNVF